mgnify:CR=1 FL=1|jgi:hypothetical protein
MHFEVLVEDASGAIMLEFFLEKILGSNGHRHTYRIHPYKGIGRLPKDLRGKADPAKRILLEQLPKLLRGYGRSLQCGDAVVISPAATKIVKNIRNNLQLVEMQGKGFIYVESLVCN